jgi:hypothetical protein
MQQAHLRSCSFWCILMTALVALAIYAAVPPTPPQATSRVTGDGLHFLGSSDRASRLPTPPATAPALQARAAGNYGKLPLAFEANAGQTDGQVKFLSRGRGYALFLTGEEAVLSLRSQKPGRKAENRNSKIEN